MRVESRSFQPLFLCREDKKQRQPRSKATLEYPRVLRTVGQAPRSADWTPAHQSMLWWLRGRSKEA